MDFLFRRYVQFQSIDPLHYRRAGSASGKTLAPQLGSTVHQTVQIRIAGPKAAAVGSAERVNRFSAKVVALQESADDSGSLPHRPFS